MTISIIILTLCLDKIHDKKHYNTDTFSVLIRKSMTIIMIMLTLCLSCVSGLSPSFSWLLLSGQRKLEDSGGGLLPAVKGQRIESKGQNRTEQNRIE